MSYCSESIFDQGVPLAHVKSLVEALGYQKCEGINFDGHVASYFWYCSQEYKSYTGVELTLYRDEVGRLAVGTRSRSGRSYWDLKQQNKTLKFLRDYLGGTFETDAGANRYWHPEGPPPTPMASGCFHARWRFHNAIGRARIYLQTRRLEGNIAAEGRAPFPWMDEMNPRLLSNNMLLPYLVAIWESFFRDLFICICTCSEDRGNAISNARISKEILERVVSGELNISEAVGLSFSFQRPNLIAKNFKSLDLHLDLATPLRRPYRGRASTLFDSLGELVERRHSFVHAGRISDSLFDAEVNRALDDFEEAVDRCYTYVAEHYGFEALRDF